jgi:hypothetical protein
MTFGPSSQANSPRLWWARSLGILLLAGAHLRRNPRSEPILVDSEIACLGRELRGKLALLVTEC